jgi:hypothetical protein
MPTRRPAAWIAGLAGAAALAGCGSSHTAAPTTTTAPVGTIQPTTTAAAAPPTTAATPPAPQPSPSDAADALIRGWQSGDRTYAASVATASAVATLFARAYQGQTVVSRGCSTGFAPYTCSYGPEGGGSGSLYQLTVSQAPAGWYVSDVRVEG